MVAFLACFSRNHISGTEGISDESLKREDWARLIRKPIKGQGHVILDLCTPDGDLQRKVPNKWGKG